MIVSIGVDPGPSSGAIVVLCADQITGKAVGPVIAFKMAQTEAEIVEDFLSIAPKATMIGTAWSKEKSEYLGMTEVNSFFHASTAFRTPTGEVEQVKYSGIASSINLALNAGFLRACMRFTGVTGNNFFMLTPQSWMKGLGFVHEVPKPKKDNFENKYAYGKALGVWSKERKRALAEFCYAKVEKAGWNMAALRHQGHPNMSWGYGDAAGMALLAISLHLNPSG